MKVIGATAHYVTPELDAGPIIVQEVRPITHETTAEQMVHLGHDIETTALCQAVRLLRRTSPGQWKPNGNPIDLSEINLLSKRSLNPHIFESRHSFNFLK